MKSQQKGGLRAILVLLRVSNLPTVWTNVLVGALLCGAQVSVGGYALLALSISLFYVGGMALNDLWDRDHDQRHRPDRPIPAGLISVSMARIICVVLFTAGLLALAVAPSPFGLAGGVVLFWAIMAYDRLHKTSPLGPYLMALCRFLTYPVTALALAGALSWPVMAGAAAMFLYVLALTLVARAGAHARHREKGGLPLVPLLIAGISLLDGLVLALAVSPWWLLVGATGAALTLAAQRFVPGD